MNTRWVNFFDLSQNQLLFIFFVLANIVCISIFAVILILNLTTKNFETKNRYFNMIIILQIAIFVVDIIYAIGYFLVPLAEGGYTIIRYTKMVYFIIGGFAGFAWFMYIEIQMGAKFSSSRTKRLIVGIPAVVSMITTIIICFITEDQKLAENPLVSISLMYIAFTYMIVASVYSIIMAFKSSSVIKKKNYIAMSLYPIGLILVSALEVFLRDIPIFCLGTTFIIFIMYVSRTQSQVSTDALTGINNRSALTRYIGEYTEFDYSYVLMIDVDRFKSINDNFGHIEGDRALIILAQALKDGCDQSGITCFLARYGGDEFIIIASASNEFDIDKFVSSLHDAVRETHTKTKDYQISVSIGYSRVHDNESILAVINNADEEMYKNKENKKRNEA